MSVLDPGIFASGFGCRVVRGPDWKWDAQDGGEGHVGTVRKFEAKGECVVVWDSGIVANYRCGELGFDLRVLDNSATGEKHVDIICENCNESPIFGIRWKCMQCLNVDLCSSCYHNDKHNLSHSFLRITMHQKTRVEVGKRFKALKWESHGLFPKARVLRGFDWTWGDQDHLYNFASSSHQSTTTNILNAVISNLSKPDSNPSASTSNSSGGKPCHGRIIDKRDWYPWSPRSAVSVAWDSGAYNVYRLGYMGMVDLKSIKSAKGGPFYVDHLPLLADLRDYDLPNLITMPNAEMNCQPSAIQQEAQNMFSVIPCDVDKLNTSHRRRGRSRPNLSRNEEVEASSSLVNALTTPGTMLPMRATASSNDANDISEDSRDDNMNLRIGDVINLVVSRETNDSKSKNDFSNMPAIVETIDSASGNIRLIFPQTGQRMNLNYRSISRGTVAQQGLPSSSNEQKTLLRKKNRYNKTTGNIPIVSANNTSQLIAANQEAGPIPSTSYGDRIKYSTIAKDDQNQIILIQNENQDIFQVRTRPRTSIALTASASNNQSELADTRRAKNQACKPGENVNEEFVRAAAEGNIKKLNWLIKNRDVNVNGSFAGSTALQVACQAGHTAAITFLLSHPLVSWKPRDPDGNQAIHAAAHGGSAEAVMTLFSFKKSNYVQNQQSSSYSVEDDGNVDINSRNNLRQTPLHLAVGRGNKEVVECLLDQCKAIHNLQDCDGDTPLHDAIASHADINLITKLLNIYQSSDFAITNNNGHNILHHAAIKGDLKVMKVILEAVRNKMPWLKDEARPDGLTALHLSVFLSRELVVDLLLANNANPSVSTSLTLMTQYDGLPIGIGPITQNSNVLQNSNTEQSPAKLFQTISCGQKMISSAIKISPLHVAASCSNSASMVCLLLCKGAKASERDSKNRFPLYFVLDRIIQLSKEAQSEKNSSEAARKSKSKKKCRVIILEANLVPFLVSVSRILIQLAETFTRMLEESTTEDLFTVPTALFQRIQSTVKASLEAGVSQIVLMAACFSAALGKECALESNENESQKIFKESKELIEQGCSDQVLRISLHHCFEGALNLTKEKNQADLLKERNESDTSDQIHEDLVSLMNASEEEQAHNNLILPDEIKSLPEDLRECLICSEKNRKNIVQPCGHLVACDDCILIIKKCVICRSPKEKSVEVPACRECTINQAVIFVQPCNHMMYCRDCLLLKYERVGPGKKRKSKFRKVDVVEVLIEAGEIFHQGKCPECAKEIDDVMTMEMSASSKPIERQSEEEEQEEETPERMGPSSNVLNDLSPKYDCDGKIVTLSKSISSLQINTSKGRFNESPGVDKELKRLQHELQAIREQTRCPICLDRSRNLVFMCGHSTCQWCGDQVCQCPICRRPVKDRIVLY